MHHTIAIYLAPSQSMIISEYNIGEVQQMNVSIDPLINTQIPLFKLF